MADIGALVERLVKRGLSIAEASTIIAEAVAAGAATAAFRRSPGALRTEKWRERNRHKASQCDTQSAMSEGVTMRHKASQSVTSDNTPLSSSFLDSRKRGARLSHDWVPSEADRSFAKQLGWSESQIDSEGANFLDYWIAKPGSGGTKLDWPATWRKWVRSSKTKPAGISVTPGASNKISVEDAVAQFAKLGSWSRYSPVTDVSQVPVDLLAKHGLLPDGRKVA